MPPGAIAFAQPIRTSPADRAPPLSIGIEHFERGDNLVRIGFAPAFGAGIRDANQVEICNGLAAGDRVANKGAYTIRLSTLSSAIPAHGHAH